MTPRAALLELLSAQVRFYGDGAVVNCRDMLAIIEGDDPIPILDRYMRDARPPAEFEKAESVDGHRPPGQGEETSQKQKEEENQKIPPNPPLDLGDWVPGSQGPGVGAKEEKKKPKKKYCDPGNGTTQGVKFPPGLDRPECHAAWAEWKAYKWDEKRFRFKTVASEQRALNAVARFGSEAFIGSLLIAMRNGWAGFFPERYTRGAVKPKDAPQVKYGPLTRDEEIARRRAILRDDGKPVDPKAVREIITKAFPGYRGGPIKK